MDSMAKAKVQRPMASPPPQVSRAMRPAGFWERFGAAFVDALILGAIRWPLSILTVLAIGMMSTSGHNSPATTAMLRMLNLALGLALTAIYVGWFYQNKGATPGKMLFKLKVVDAESGTYLSFSRAIRRDIVGKFISAMLMMGGYLMAAFREDKRALHDLMAKSQVIRQD
jgi:uncharacterized RDD family membrane protein YckC